MAAGDEKTLFYLKRLLPSDKNKYMIIPFKGDEVVIGRAQGISYTIADILISRRHAVFRRKPDNSWTITNLSSSGVLLNDVVLPLNLEKNLHVSNTVQFCCNLKKFVYKFGCKVLSAKRKAELSQNTHQLEVDGASVHRTESLLKKHIAVQDELRRNKDKFNEMLLEKELLKQSLEAQKQQLHQCFQQERDELLRQKSDEQQRAVKDLEEALVAQQHEKITQLEERFDRDRQLLESDLEREAQRQQEQDAILLQLQEEKAAMHAALEEERGYMEQQKDLQLHREMEIEQKMQEELRRVQERLLQKEQDAVTLSVELKEKEAAGLRLAEMEVERERLQTELDEAKERGCKVTELQESVQKMAEDKANLQSEMEIMEFAVTAEAKKSVVDTVQKVMDSEMQCPICNELFIKAILLNCSHTFCMYCIDCWKKRRRDCPTCRTSITSETRSRTIDNFIERIVGSLSEEMKNNRNEMIKEREDEIAAAAAAVQAAAEARRGGRRGRSTRRGSTRARGRGAGRGRGSASTPPVVVLSPPPAVAAGAAAAAAAIGRAGPSGAGRAANYNVSITLSSSSDTEEDISRSYMSDSTSVSGDDTVFYGDYGRCYNCGRRGHWANGCPGRY